MPILLQVLNYEESRLEFLREEVKLHEQKLHWWRHQKPGKQYSLAEIMFRCAYHGNAVAYLNDAIVSLGCGEQNQREV